MAVGNVQTEVSTYAGATLSISVSSNAREFSDFMDDDDSAVETTGISMANAEVEVVTRQYFNANGAEMPEMTKGLNIVKTTYSNGKTEVKKIMVR